MSVNPGSNSRVFMRPIIIHNQMHVQLGRSLGIDLLDETNKLLMSVTGHTIANDFAIERAERSRQRGGPAVPVVGGHPAATPFLHG